MTPEERSLLQRAVELGEENHRILRSLQKNARLATFMRAAYWIVIIGLSFGAIYFIQPYLNVLAGLTGQDGTSFSAHIQSLLK